MSNYELWVYFGVAAGTNSPENNAILKACKAQGFEAITDIKLKRGYNITFDLPAGVELESYIQQFIEVFKKTPSGYSDILHDIEYTVTLFGDSVVLLESKKKRERASFIKT